MFGSRGGWLGFGLYYYTLFDIIGYLASVLLSSS